MNRRCSAVQLFTFRRAWDEGIFLGDCNYLLRVTPDDGEPIDMRSPTVETVRAFLAEMEPHTVEILVRDDEDRDAVAAALTGKVH